MTPIPPRNPDPEEPLDPQLAAVVAAILDGTPVDWSSLGASGGSSSFTDELQIVAGIAAVHRSAADEPADPLHFPPSYPWTVGTLIITASLGTGSFGEVFRAWDTQLHRDVAVKLLYPRAGDRNGERALAEGRLLARVRHPNVVTVHDVERIEGRVALVTEFVSGRTLAQIVSESGPLAALDVVMTGIDLCRALAAVHDAGLLHRDVKAQNVMRDANGRTVLMDFGAGKDLPQAAEVQAGRDRAGTPLYTAPEVGLGAEATRESDIYSLGVLLFYLASGTFPVQGSTTAEIQEAHRAGRRARLRAVRPGVPRPLADVVERAIAPEPAARYESAGAFEAALQRSQQPPESVRHARWLLAAAALIVTAGGVALLPGPSPVTWLLRAGGSPPAAAAAPVADLISTSVRQLKPPGIFVEFGAPSRDGRLLPYTNPDGELWIWEIATGRSWQVTKKSAGEGFAWSPVMSADGRRIAYAWQRADGLVDLKVVEADGGSSRVVLAGDSGRPAQPSLLEWERDGRRILCLLSLDDGSSELALVSLDGGATTTLASFRSVRPRHATLSPDGHFVVYDVPSGERTGDRDLMIVRSYGGSPPVPLLAGAFNDLLPSWTADGNGIFFASDRSGEMCGWLLPMSGDRAAGETTLVARNLGRIWPLGLTDAGVYFYALQIGAPEVYSAEVDLSGASPAGKPVRISDTATMGHTGPSWSPDGRRIVYVAQKGRTASDLDANVLVIQDVASGAMRRLDVSSLSFVGLAPPRWSANARQLLVRGRDRQNREGLHVVDVETGAVLSSHHVTGVRFFWSADGRSILYGRVAPASVIQRSVATGQETVLVDAADQLVRLVSFAPSPDGRAIALSGLRKDDQRWGIFVHAASSGLMEIHRGGTRLLAVQDWTSDGRQILFSLAGAEQPHRLMRIDAGGGAPVEVLPINGWTIPNWLDLSPDGTGVAFTGGEYTIQIWMMENFLPR